MHEYEMTVKVNVDIGHMAIGALRDSVEDMVSGAIQDNEELTTEIVSDSEIKVRLNTPNELGDSEAESFREAVEDAVKGVLDPDAGERVEVGKWTMTSYPGMVPGQ